MPGHAHKHGTVGVRRRPLHHAAVCAQRHEVRVVAHGRPPSLSQELGVCGVDEVIIREAAAAAAAVVGQEAGGGYDAQRRIGAQAVSVHSRQLRFAAVPAAVFEGEGAGVEGQRVELQGAGGRAGVERRLGG